MTDVIAAYGKLLAAGYKRFGLNPIGLSAQFLSPDSRRVLTLEQAIKEVEERETVQTQS